LIHDEGIFERLLASPLFIVVGVGVGLLVVSYIIARGRLEDEGPSLFERLLRWVGVFLVVGSAAWAYIFGIPREVPKGPCETVREIQEERRQAQQEGRNLPR
jgi:hypothetical protein